MPEQPHVGLLGDREAVVLPVGGKLYTNDGRVIAITTWEPRVSVEEAYTVKIEGIICRKDDE